MPGHKILLLGGTGIARKIASCLIEEGHQITTSLAGRTKNPVLPPGEVRTGGFGGVQGLSNVLKNGGYSLLLDATHPFATRISDHAAKASKLTGIALLRFQYPPWLPQEGDLWIDAESLAHAMALLSPSERVFAALGQGAVSFFLKYPNIQIFSRLIEPWQGEKVPHITLIQERPPFSYASEIALLRSHNISVLLVKNSGAEDSCAKLQAARFLSLPVIMIRRPPQNGSISPAGTIEELLEQLRRIPPYSSGRLLSF